jgi:serine/threonine-protein kinase ULK/ATG1
MLFLREHNVAHMDLKPQNILLTSVTSPTMKIAGTSFYRFGILHTVNTCLM